MMRIRICVGLMAVTLSFLGSGTAMAQEEASPSPKSCGIGALCPEVGEQVKGGGSETKVDDPPGSYVASLVTLTLITLVVGGYVLFALTGRSLWRRKRA
ncbi:MAG: hypothetical protein ABIS18_08165 [Actinomycetota bacterium]